MTPERQTPERHRAAKEILGAVLECPKSARQAFLEARCAGDEALLREVESLLEYESTLDVLSGEPIVSLGPKLGRGWDEGERVGPYRIVRRLGYGGMGAVYLAEQEDPVRRRVAVKLIHRGMDTDEILRRFQLERQILAELRHPYIAGLLDAGVTGDGRPYFAMEYVEGEPIDEYCEREGLDVEERLELFLKVSEAVGFSHQNLVIHRDLKPSNILVTAEGTPRLLDFGIAKILDPSPTLPALTTLLGSQPMTPAYASPELIRHRPAGTASDVYSLGVILYRLLAGRHPYVLRGREVEQVVCEEEPKRPSTAVGTLASAIDAPRVDVRKWKREIAGDLDAVVLKALRKEPQERYHSVESFAADLSRYLEGRPVQARAGTFTYRAGKFLRRHRLALATGAVFLVTVIGFVIALFLQVERVRAERNRANMSHDLFVEILENTDPEDEEEILTPEGVVRRGVDLLGESFEREREVHATVFDSLGRVYAKRGYYESARSLLAEALEIRRETLGEDHTLVAESLFNLAQLLGETGEHERAAELTSQGLSIQRKYYAGPHVELARAIHVHAMQLGRLGRYEEARALYLESHEMRVALYGDAHLSVATSFAALGSLYQRMGDFEKARQSYLRSLEIRRRLLPPMHPSLGSSYNLLGTVLLEKGNDAEAEPLLRRALEIRRDRYGDQHPHVAASLYGLALALRNLERYDEAEPLFREALAIRCDPRGEERRDCAATQSGLASLLLAQDRVDAAREMAFEALVTFTNLGPQWQVANVKALLAECLASRGRYEEAEAPLLESLSVLKEVLGDQAAATRNARRRLVGLYQAWGRPEKAEEYRGSTNSQELP